MSFIDNLRESPQEGTLVRVLESENVPDAVGKVALSQSSLLTSPGCEFKTIEAVANREGVRGHVWSGRVQALDPSTVPHGLTQVPDGYLPKVGSTVLGNLDSRSPTGFWVLGTVQAHDLQDVHRPLRVQFNGDSRWCYSWLETEVNGIVTGEAPQAMPDAEALRERIATLERMLAQESQDRWNTVRELEQFKDTVKETAVRYAREYDWCDTVRGALAEMGLDWPQRWVEFNVVVSLQMRAQVVNSGVDPNGSFIQESIQSTDFNVDLDSDFDNAEVQDYSILSVEDIEVTDE